jgi:dUTP pyrophosphatase
MKVKVKKLVSNAVTPSYAKNGDMGMDIVATSVEYDHSIDCYVYHTGLSFEVPEGYGMLIFPRSSNRKRDCYLPNSVGVLDSGYRGELLFCFKDRNSLYMKTAIKGILALAAETSVEKAMDTVENECINLKYAPYEVGDKIGQIIIIPYPQITFEESDTLSDSDRGKGGFGSTGK